MLPTAIVYTLWNTIHHLLYVHKLRKNHAMSDGAIQARAAQDYIVPNKEYVCEQLKK